MCQRAQQNNHNNRNMSSLTGTSRELPVAIMSSLRSLRNITPASAAHICGLTACSTSLRWATADGADTCCVQVSVKRLIIRKFVLFFFPFFISCLRSGRRTKTSIKRNVLSPNCTTRCAHAGHQVASRRWTGIVTPSAAGEINLSASSQWSMIHTWCKKINTYGNTG